MPSLLDLAAFLLLPDSKFSLQSLHIHRPRATYPPRAQRCLPRFCPSSVTSMLCPTSQIHAFQESALAALCPKCSSQISLKCLQGCRVFPSHSILCQPPILFLLLFHLIFCPICSSKTKSFYYPEPGVEFLGSSFHLVLAFQVAELLGSATLPGLVLYRVRLYTWCLL